MLMYKDLWEEFYKDGKHVMWFPSEPAVKFFGRISKDMDIRCMKGLDFGCGVGRNTVFMDKLGLYAYGIDISEESIRLGNLNFSFVYPSKLMVYNGTTIPFEDNFFDFVISHGVLDHMVMDKAKECMKEIHRVLKPKGWCELEIHSIYDSNYGKGMEIEENIFIIEEGCEKGLPQHYFEELEIFELVEGFKIKRMLLNEEVDFINKHNKTSFWVLYLEKI